MKLIIFLLSLLFLICSETPWTYSQCYNYLDNLNIICYTINKNYSGNEICEKWEVKSKDYIDNMPNECFNKEYNLELYIKDSNPPLKKKLILFLDIFKDIFFIEKNIYEYEDNKISITNLSNDIEDIQQCFNNYFKYENLCGDNNIINEKDEELCNELYMKKNNKICKDLINSIEKNIFTNLKDYKVFDNIIINIRDGYNNIFENIDQIKYINEDNDENIENINNNFDFEEENNNNEEESGEVQINNDKKIDYDNELEIYYNKTRKDCVEYGLEDNYIVCTKYE